MKRRGMLAITMGDPAGVGPEIVLKALATRQAKSMGPFLLVGDAPLFERVKKRMNIPIQLAAVSERELEGQTFSRPGSPADAFVVPSRSLHRGRLKQKAPSKEGGKASLAWIETGVRLALEGLVDGVVTAPVSKVAMALAGSPFRGHTDLIAHLTKTRKPVMFFAGPGMRIALVTTHIPLRRIPRSLSCDKILSTIQITARALSRFWGISRPLLGVLSLNPHGGEGGLMGQEEQAIILPAIRAARRSRIRCEGPLSADTAFLPEGRKRYHGYVAMYHDQALVALKTLLFRKSVNITLGLPVIRTSVDHGTAFEIAGMGTADPGSMIQAIRMARFLARASRPPMRKGR